MEWKGSFILFQYTRLPKEPKGKLSDKFSLQINNKKHFFK
jgi:hypothetical protein